MSGIKRLIVVSSIVLTSIGVDQLTKVLAQQFLRGQPPHPYLGDFFRWDYAENPGAFLSLGSTLSSPMRFWLLSVAVAVFLGGLLYFILTSPGLKKLQVYSLSLIMGGGLSNLIDRFFRPHGRVVDFMNMGIGGLRTGVFNVADMLIMAGIFVFAFLNFFDRDTDTARSGRDLKTASGRQP